MIAQSRNLKQELETIRTIDDLTGVFENIASTQIRAVRQKVLGSKLFFNDLWQLYQQLRVDVSEIDLQLGKDDRPTDLAILFSAPIGISGETDRHLVDQLIEDLKVAPADVLVIGSHGNQLLEEKGIQPVRAFNLPDITKPFGVGAIVDMAKKYDKTRVYYDAYISLTVQKPTSMELLISAQQLTEEERAMIRSGEAQVISPHNYIFEPSVLEVVHAMEDTMLNTTITQILLESRLSQVARRFTTMTLAHQRAESGKKAVYLQYQASRRAERDEMSRQITTAVRFA